MYLQRPMPDPFHPHRRRRHRSRRHSSSHDHRSPSYAVAMMPGVPVFPSPPPSAYHQLPSPGFATVPAFHPPQVIYPQVGARGFTYAHPQAAIPPPPMFYPPPATYPFGAHGQPALFHQHVFKDVGARRLSGGRRNRGPRSR